MGRITNLPAKMEQTLTLDRSHPPTGFQNQVEDSGKDTGTTCKTELQLVVEQRLRDEGGKGEPKLIKLFPVEIEARQDIFDTKPVCHC